jgi:Holliday junction resolvase RusA-like endonuclease
MRKTYTTTITMSPTVNNLYANVPGKGRRMTGHYKVWRQGVVTYMALTLKRIDGPVRIDYMFNLGSTFRGDLSNRIKAIEDALVEAGIIKGDTFSVVVAAAYEHRRVEDKESSVTITLTPVVIE